MEADAHSHIWGIDTNMPTNRLSREKSPYLLQHAHNPVDWFPWGEEAFETARREDKPIFLSIGYSTCHWCHVMERESFESHEIAEILNREFVPVKVDREERPDVDRVYMTYVQAATGGGGWPMSVWLTPELHPFFGGTYFPPDNRYGRPGFKVILEAIAQAWRADRERIESSGREAVEQLRRYGELSGQGPLSPQVLDACWFTARRVFDAEFGGFGDAPKFPRPALHNFLLRYACHTGNPEPVQMVARTLERMARGGIHDHLGGGFHRYSVDERWFVPHFEKMLYDQAQLAVSYLEAFQLTRRPLFASVARGVLDYVLRDMTDAEGGFYSAEDADSAPHDSPESEKREGALYVWNWEELRQRLGDEEAARFAKHYGVEVEGNVVQDPHGEFIGQNILYEREPCSDGSLERAKGILLAARNQRPKPHRDDKILTAWNALMVSAFAKGAQVLGEERYAQAALRAADFLLSRMWNPATGQLLRRYRHGEAAIAGFLDDYAFLVLALIDLYETDFNLRWLEFAVAVAESMIRRFEDPSGGAFFSAPPEDSALVLRLKDDYDGAEPSGNSAAALALLRLAEFTGRADFRRSAHRTLEAFAKRLTELPFSLPQMLVAYQLSLAPPQHAVLTGDRADAAVQSMLRRLHAEFAVHRTLILLDTEPARERFAEWLPFTREMRPLNGRPAAYICRNCACDLPVTDPNQVTMGRQPFTLEE